MGDPFSTDPDLEQDAPVRYDAQGLVRMNEDDCWELLRRNHIGRVALVQFGRPLVYPVNYAVDRDSIVFRSAPGSKLTAAAREALVGFEVDEVDELFERGASVIVHGKAGEITDPSERERVDRLPIRRWAPGDRDHLVRITAQWVTGREIPLSTDADGLGADGG